MHLDQWLLPACVGGVGVGVLPQVCHAHSLLQVDSGLCDSLVLTALAASLFPVVCCRSHKATCKTRGKINDLGHIGTVVKGQRRWVLRRLLCVSNLKH